MKKKIINQWKRVMLVIGMSLILTACTTSKFATINSENTEESDTTANDDIPILSILDSSDLPDSIDVSLKEFTQDSPSEEELDKFNEAYELWYNDNTKDALASFMVFPKLYPNSCLNDDSQKYMGLCYNDLSMYDYALEAFSKIITDYPDSPLVASAYYNIGYTYYYNYSAPELSYPYYVACLKNVTTDDKQIVEHAIEILSNETNIDISYDAPLEEETKEETSEEETEEKTTSTSSMEESNALSAAIDYLDYTAFSHDGLIEQLEFEGYSKEAATYAADNCGADWKEQAAKKAQEYLDYSSFSRSGLIEQLEYEGFTKEQAEYGATAVGY